ncbi:MAG: GPO family capsid scaffolding protein [Ectothiorhodospiraceae bacterium]|nr:GPO family capsid scaffolding protein [Ectothiorhodospiraceae bacterium]
MAAKTKWFRVATEGATTDGRTISRQWIEQIANNYDPQRYGARVWMEHMRGMFPDGPFRAYGDVAAVKAEENGEGKLELYVQLEPTEDLVRMNKERQKVYTSIEVDPEFADSGEAYMVGLGVTDSPASLGTEMLQFSAQAKSSPLSARKQRPENLFTAAVEVELELEEDAPTNDKPSLLDTVKALFRKHRRTGEAEFAAFRSDLEDSLKVMAEAHQELIEVLEDIPTAEEFSELKAAHQKLKTDFAELHAQLDTTPDTPSRSSATGAPAAIQTDC